MKQEITTQYKEMSNEEYKKAIIDRINDIEDNQILRYFHIFITEKLKGVH